MLDFSHRGRWASGGAEPLVHQQHDIATGDTIDFVVLRGGQWLSAPLPATEPAEVSVDEVTEMLRRSSSEPGLPAHDSPSDDTPLPGASDTITPAWVVAGRVAHGTLVVGTSDGDHITLDPTDIAILDATRNSATPAAICTRSGTTEHETLSRIARLAAAGLLQVASAVPQTPTGQLTPSAPGLLERVRVAYELSSKLTGVRRLVSRFRQAGDARRSNGSPARR